MTNREWLNTLSSFVYAREVLSITAYFEEKNFDPRLDIFDINVGTELDFEEWLDAEHGENNNECGDQTWN